MTEIGWRIMLPCDPLPWLLASAEPAARWTALVELLDQPPGNPVVREARRLSAGSDAAR